MKKSVISVTLAIVLFISIVPHALAAEIGEMSLVDDNGYVYALSNPVVGVTSLTFYDDLETYKIQPVKVYLVPQDTIITLPSIIDGFSAKWYAPDENAMGGWKVAVEEPLDAATDIPINAQVITPDGSFEHTVDIGASLLRLRPMFSFKAIYIQGVDVQSTDSTKTPIGINNFKKSASYPGFSDVQGNIWYADNVKQAYELGLMNGKGSGKFDPSGTLTLAEAVTIAARINSIYQGTSFSPGGNPWYSNAVAYSTTRGIISDEEFSDFTKLATRMEFARILYKSIPSQEFTQVNQIDQIPDVVFGSANSESIYALYRAGILTGNNDGSFNPDNSITRAEAAAIINRVVLPQNRVVHSITANTAKEEISSASGDFTIAVAKETDWTVKRDELNTKNGVYEFFYQSKTGRAAMRVFVLSKSSFPNMSVLSAATAMKNDCLKQGSTIGENGIYSGSIANYSGSVFDYTFINDKGITWKGKFTFFETPNRIYGVQQETNENCSEADRNTLNEVASSLNPIS